MQIMYEISRERNENLYFEKNKDNIFQKHFHKKIEIMYITKGNKKINFNGKKYNLTKNQLFIADSYQIHAYYKCPDSFQTIVVFPNKYLTSYYEIFGGEILADNFITDTNYCKMLLPFINNLENKELNPLLYQANINMLLGLIVQKVGVTKKTLQYDLGLIGDILNYINDNYEKNLSLDNLAQHFGYSKYYFSRLFNSCLHTTITDYISIIRVSKVIEMLKNENCSVTNAIYSCGFSSLPTFYRCLKKNYTYKKIEDLLQ